MTQWKGLIGQTFLQQRWHLGSVHILPAEIKLRMRVPTTRPRNAVVDHAGRQDCCREARECWLGWLDPESQRGKASFQPRERGRQADADVRLAHGSQPCGKEFGKKTDKNRRREQEYRREAIGRKTATTGSNRCNHKVAGRCEDNSQPTQGEAGDRCQRRTVRPSRIDQSAFGNPQRNRIASHAAQADV